MLAVSMHTISCDDLALHIAQVDSLLDIEVSTGGDVNAESLGPRFLREVSPPPTLTVPLSHACARLRMHCSQVKHASLASSVAHVHGARHHWISSSHALQRATHYTLSDCHWQRAALSLMQELGVEPGSFTPPAPQPLTPEQAANLDAEVQFPCHAFPARTYLLPLSDHASFHCRCSSEVTDCCPEVAPTFSSGASWG